MLSPVQEESIFVVFFLLVAIVRLIVMTARYQKTIVHNVVVLNI